MNIFNYSDYRLYLKDAIFLQQKENCNLSIREILRRIGTASPSYFKEVVIDSKKNMSPAMARKFAEYLNLDSGETSYFLSMIDYNQASTESERVRCYEEVLKCKNSTACEHHFLELREYGYLSSWELSAIRELLTFYKGFKNESPEERKKMADLFLPKLSEEQIDKAIKALETMKFISRNSENSYRKTGHNIRSVKKTPAAYISLCQNMRHALDIINRAPPESRIFKNVVLSMSSKTYDIIENKINSFCKEILDIVSSDTSPEDCLYLIGLQFFPLTRTPKEKK